jgi:hypothetical protein
MPNSGSLSIGGSDQVGSDQSHARAPPAPKPPKRAAPATPVVQADSGQCLAIEQDPETGGCLYTVTDRDSGEVLARWPRDQVAKMGDEAGYAAGALIKAKA